MKEEFRVFMCEMKDYLKKSPKSRNEEREEKDGSPDWEYYDDDSVASEGSDVRQGEGVKDLIDLKGGSVKKNWP